MVLDTLQAVIAITLIDLAMSGDNALIIGMVARGLPQEQRRKAILLGAGAAVAISLENILGVGAAAHGSIALLLFGLGLSIPIVLFGSTFVVALLDRFPQAT